MSQICKHQIMCFLRYRFFRLLCPLSQSTFLIYQRPLSPCPSWYPWLLDLGLVPFLFMPFCLCGVKMMLWSQGSRAVKGLGDLLPRSSDLVFPRWTSGECSPYSWLGREQQRSGGQKESALSSPWVFWPSMSYVSCCWEVDWFTDWANCSSRSIIFPSQ